MAKPILKINRQTNVLIATPLQIHDSSSSCRNYSVCIRKAALEINGKIVFAIKSMSFLTQRVKNRHRSLWNIPVQSLLLILPWHEVRAHDVI